METKVYQIMSIAYDGEEYTREITLPSDIQFYQDDAVDGVHHNKLRNYCAFYKKSEYDDTLVKKNGLDVQLQDWGEYFMVYLRDRLFIGDHPTYVPHLEVPKVSIICFSKQYNYRFEQVLYPIKYAGGGDFLCIRFFIDYMTQLEDKGALVERLVTKVQVSEHSHFDIMAVNGKCADTYRDGILEYIQTGHTKVDFRPIETLVSKGLLMPSLTDERCLNILKGNEVVYKDV